MKVLLAGGGTGGSVTPLLAITEELNVSNEKMDFLWLGSKNGIEKKMIDNFNFTYQSFEFAQSKSKHNVIPSVAEESNVPCANSRVSFPSVHQTEIIKFQSIYNGKLRRYFSFKNFIDLFRIKLGFFQSFWIILKYKPDIILTAGSFIAVPVVWAGWILRVPVLVHQQDVKVGLANRLMAPFATIVTCSLEKSIKDFKNKKVYLTGNAVRKKILNTGSTEELGKKFNLEKGIPTVLILGGGTGAEAVNTIIVHCIPNLTKFCNIIHITGGKIVPPFPKEPALSDSRMGGAGGIFQSACHCNYKKSNYASTNLRKIPLNPPLIKGEIDRYHAHPFLNNIEEAYATADLVISRAGMGVLSELAILEKPIIIIPIPDSHQEANAKYFADRNTAVVLDQKNLTSEKLTETIKNLLADKKSLEKLSYNISKIMPKNGAERILEIIMDEIKKL